MANMCAKVTSIYMEFTLAFGPKPEFSFSFKCIKNRIVVREKSTNKNRTFVLFLTFIYILSKKCLI